MATKIIWLENGIIFKHSESVTLHEVVQANDAMYADSRFDKLKFQISDFTDVIDNKLRIEDAKIVGVLDKNSAVWNKKMLNIVITKDENFIPIVEQYFSALKDLHWQCKIYDTLEKAMEWINTQIE